MAHGFLVISWVMAGIIRDEICAWMGICGGKKYLAPHFPFCSLDSVERKKREGF